MIWAFLYIERGSIWGFIVRREGVIWVLLYTERGVIRSFIVRREGVIWAFVEHRDGCSMGLYCS